MKRIAKISVWALLAIVLLPVGTSAQSRRDKEQTYVLEQPYEVTKITPPQGKKVKNVILMIGDGMSLMDRKQGKAFPGQLPGGGFV